ncbi:SMI1/KNR4 family protein [Deinococcus sp. A31D244]|uniref:SMI1/KNR4 family protein n=1 Tax=Deinococcus sp. A31D244 TaxID=3397675 RepID=UPI0039DFAE8D
MTDQESGRSSGGPSEDSAWEAGSGRALISLAVLRLIEDAVGQPFPADYLEVIRTRNAAYFERQDFPVSTPDGPEERSVAVLLSADGDETDAESVLSQWRTLQDEHGFGPRVVPFGMDGGGNLVCFDFSAAGNPAVVSWQHDEAWEPIRVAESFAAFLERLS